MGFKRSSLDGRKSKTKIIFLLALITQYLFILVRKGGFFIEKKIQLFLYFSLSDKKNFMIRMETSIFLTKKSY